MTIASLDLHFWIVCGILPGKLESSGIEASVIVLMDQGGGGEQDRRRKAGVRREKG